MSNILIINSSPRNDSNTRLMAAMVAEGAGKNGHAVTTIEIGKADIHPCIGCKACKVNPGKCVFDDAMTVFYVELQKADTIIFASPIYYFNINAQAKLFLDRTYALGVDAFENKRIGAVFAYGDVDPVKSGCINALRTFQDICAFVSAKWVGAVYGSAWEKGDAAKNPELLKMAVEFGETL